MEHVTGNNGTYRPTDDERALSLVAHVCIFLTCIGTIIAAITWIYAQGKMPYAAFQAAQAVLYQLTVMLAALLIAITIVALMLGFLALTIFTAPVAGDVTLNLLIALMNFVTGVPVAVFMLLVYGYAVYAGYQSYRGLPFRIPGIVVLANAISPMPPVESEGRTR
jgi:uncharacterized Tic20 family protein